MLSQPVVSSSDDWGSGLFSPVAITSLNTTSMTSVFGSNTASNSLLEGASKLLPALPLSQDTVKPLFSPTTAAQPGAVRRVTGSTQVPGASTLSQEDLEAFKANKFTLGEIPEHPPPDLC